MIKMSKNYSRIWYSNSISHYWNFSCFLCIHGAEAPVVVCAMYAIVSSNQWLLISVINDMNTTEMTTLQPPSTQDYGAARLRAFIVDTRWWKYKCVEMCPSVDVVIMCSHLRQSTTILFQRQQIDMTIYKLSQN